MKNLQTAIQRTAFWQRVFRTRAEDTLPHYITHQRVYILPSKRGCAFLFTLLLMLIASINYALSLGYALSFLLTGLFSACLLHTYRNLAGLGVSSIEIQDLFAGSAGEIIVTLDNQHARLRHGISVSTQHTRSPLTHADAHATAQANLPIKPQSRGVFQAGRITLQSDWPLGLWTCWSYLHVPGEALVFPAPETNPPPLPAIASHEEGNRHTLTNTGDVAGLREYQPGDSIGSIAWKSAARGLGLRSRLFEDESQSTRTVLSLEQAAIPGLEAQLSRLCAWVLLAESKNTDYAVQLPTSSLPEGLGKEQKLNALTALSLHDQPSFNSL